MEIPLKGPWPSPPVPNGLAEEPQSSSTKPTDVEGKPADRDSLRLTRSGQEFIAAVQYARSLPEIREDRVMRLKRQLEQGTYHVQGDRIAANLIDESLENNNLLESIVNEE